jgi:hypothetical protein
MVPLIFLINGLALMLFMFLTDPSSFFSFFVWALITLSYLFEIITIENFFSRNVPKEIRGVAYGVFFFSGLIGRLLCYKTAAILFREDGRNSPFLMIGYCHFGFVIFVLVMIGLGKF